MIRIIVALLATLWVGVAVCAPPVPAASQQEARELLAELVAFDTSAGKGQVPAMAALLAERLAAAGFEGEDIQILPFGDTASLVVRYRGDGSGGKPILLLAHMDVVPANPQDWSRDPFTLVEEDGYFFGRGTEDIKGEIATIVTTFIRLKREGFVPTRDLVIVFTGDEETDQATTRDLIENHRELIDAEFALNGDGGGGILDDDTGEARLYYLQGAEKSYASFELSTRNPGGHSSEPRVENAIYELADALKALQAFQFPVMSNEWTRASLAAAGAATPGELGKALTRFAANPDDVAAANILAAEPAYVGRTRTTCVATMLAAGHAENALPQRATATVNCRIFPGTATAAVGETLREVVGDKVEVKLVSAEFDSVASPLRPDVLSAVEDAVRANHPGIQVVPDQASYYTDGSFFRGGGIPTYGTSSLFVRNRDSFAHGLNERISVEAFQGGLNHWYVLIRNLATGSSGAPTL